MYDACGSFADVMTLLPEAKESGTISLKQVRALRLQA